jgi:hypothetical protein
MTKSRNILPPRKPWSDKEREQLRRDYPNVRTETIAQQLGRTLCTVYNQAAKLGLTKSEEYLASPDACRLRRGDNVGAAYRFPKGHAPANKGTRRPGWAAGRMRETQFRKGERRGVAVKLYKAIGTERISKDGYLERKINDDMPLQRRWRFVHLIVWEAANGPVPPGHAIAFKPGRKTNKSAEITVDALELVTRRDLMLRNTVHNLPKPIAELVQLRGVLQRQINKRVKHG